MTKPTLAVIHGNEVDQDVLDLWAAVFRCSAIVIQHAKKFGFTGMTEPDPNIHDLIMYVKLVEGAIDVLVETPDAVSIEEMRMLLNAQKQFTTLKMVAKIVESKGSHRDFEDAMRELENQAQI